MNSNITLPELKKAYEMWHGKIAVSPISKHDRKFGDWILDHLPKDKGSLLDVACGKGVLLRLAAERGYETCGIDISDAAVRSTKMTLADLLCVGVAENLPFRNDFFDFVTCIGSLEHFPSPERALKEIVRVLKRGGQALVYVPNAYFIGHIYIVWRHGLPPSEAGQEFSERFMTLMGWRKLLEDSGLRVLKVSKWNYISSASKKVSSLARHFYNMFLRPFIPLNLSYSFLFVCKKVEDEKT